MWYWDRIIQVERFVSDTASSEMNLIITEILNIPGYLGSIILGENIIFADLSAVYAPVLEGKILLNGVFL